MDAENAKPDLTVAGQADETGKEAEKAKQAEQSADAPKQMGDVPVAPPAAGGDAPPTA